MSEKPNFARWARNIAAYAQLGEGIELNLPYDLIAPLEDAYRLGKLDAQIEMGKTEDQANAKP